MGLELGMITTDSIDPEPLAQWWADVLEGQIVADHDGWFVVVVTRAGTLGFQRVEAVTPGKNRTHLDLVTSPEELDRERERLIAAGASDLGRREADDDYWYTLADPQGNVFCLAPEEA